ncbi:MAG: polynucleotide adenylyltransferase PcnB [Bacteroidetes bacterium]|nr:polynucleotide adenylyltransferase PcnB [Bacteroidota bacterium]
MLKRYKINKTGKRITTAHIYTGAEHGIQKSKLDLNAVKIIEKLKRGGFDAYIVGGAVRDLLIGKQPKDFDIATNAYPKQIRKLFWNSRIIGRRFKLAHIYFQEKIFEVSTFRSSEQGELGEHNIYGTIEEDASRRDFSINSLYYDPLEGQIFDFTNAMRDIREKRVRSIIPLSITFIEDPVRMIRCIKYTETTGFSMPYRLSMSIRRHASELKLCSSSRMTEEIFKILQSGYSCIIIKKLHMYGLFGYMLPIISNALPKKRKTTLSSEFFNSLNDLDLEINNTMTEMDVIDSSVRKHSEKEIFGVQKSRMLAALIDPFLSFPDEYENSHELFKDIFKQIKQLISPLTPANYEVEKTAALLFKRENIKVPKNAVRKPNTSIPAANRKSRNSSARKRTNKSRIKPVGKPADLSKSTKKE